MKLSRDYRKPEAIDDFDYELIAGGWLLLDHDKIQKSSADWWVIILVSHERKLKPQFIVIPPSELLSRLQQIHGNQKNTTFIRGLQSLEFVWMVEEFGSKTELYLTKTNLSLDLVI